MKNRPFFDDTALKKWSLRNGYAPIFPPCLIKKLTLFPSKPKSPTSSYTVHVKLGPGLLEKVYEVCFCYELEKRGLRYRRQVILPIHYDGMTFDEGLRLDVFVEEKVICELKAVKELRPIDQAQIISHIKLLDRRLGFLINFHVVRIKDGIHRFINT